MRFVVLRNSTGELMKRLQATSLLVGLSILFIQADQNSALANPFKSEKKSAESSDSISMCSERNKFGHHALKVQIKINAPAPLVWEAIRENRLADPDVQYSKFTQISETQRLLEQKYTSLPVFGSTTCTLQLEENVHKRIDYNLIKSDRLSEFEGSWVLTPCEEDGTTMLELSNHLKLNIPLPQKLLDAFAAPKMKSRVLWVKQVAENKRQSQIASRE